MNNRNIRFLIAFINAVFIVFYATLCLHNRFAVDDYDFLYQEKQYGIIKSTLYYYNTWNGRWFAILWLQIWLRFADYQYLLFTYGITTLIAFASSIHFLLYALEKRFFFSIKAPHRLNYTLLFTCASFCSTIGIADTWFWITTSPMYLWGLIAFILFLGLIFKNNNYLLPLLTFIALYIGASNEPLAVFFIVLCSIVIVYQYLKKQQLVYQHALWMCLGTCLLAFISVCVAPGVQERRNALPAPTLFITGKAFVTAVIKLIALKLPLKVFTSALLLIPCYSIGEAFEGIKKITFPPNFIFKMLIICGLSIALIALVPAYALQEMGPDRALAPIGFLMVLLFITIYFYWGYTGSVCIKPVFITCSLTGAALFVLLMGCYQYRITKNYAAKVDNRISRLKDLNENNYHGPAVMVSPLPSSGLLYNSEISTDTAHFSNKDIQKALSLPFKIYRGN